MAEVLIIGGSGEISLAVVKQALAQGHSVTVFNRAKTEADQVPAEVKLISGDMFDEVKYRSLTEKRYDVVCQFMIFEPEHLRRDIEIFAGRTDQYVFISSASAYQKPALHYIITEDVPLENPFWEYSRKKAACEQLLRNQTRLPYTIVRPSHTLRNVLPIEFGDQMRGLRRILAGKPLVVTGDGTSPWTLTPSKDFAVPFVNLWGKEKAIGDFFHITNSKGFTWDQIHQGIARQFGTDVENVHVPTDTLLRYNPDWEGPLMGDKTWTALFDNSKVKSVAGDFTCADNLDDILREPCAFAKRYLETGGGSRVSGDPNNAKGYAEDEDDMMDRIIADQRRLGTRVAVPA